MPLVSIIMNVRNGVATLREAIDSVLAQSFADWELIVWDDQSSDGSADIVAAYHDPRIRYHLAQEHHSLGRARRDAIEQAQGEWIAFLDQDDLWLPGKLERQMALVSDSVGMIYGRAIRFYPGGAERDYDQTHEYQPLPEGDIFGQLFSKSCFPAMSSAIFRRSAIEAVGGIPEAVRIIPDYYLYAAIARRYEVRAVQQPVCRYRMHGGNMSELKAIAMHQEALWLVDQFETELAPEIVRRCHQRHQTAIALEEIKSPKTFWPGLVRLFTKGSVGSQVARPFLYVFHLVRRNVRQPYWKKLS